MIRHRRPLPPEEIKKLKKARVSDALGCLLLLRFIQMGIFTAFCFRHTGVDAEQIKRFSLAGQIKYYYLASIGGAMIGLFLKNKLSGYIFLLFSFAETVALFIMGYWIFGLVWLVISTGWVFVLQRDWQLFRKKRNLTLKETNTLPQEYFSEKSIDFSRNEAFNTIDKSKKPLL